MERSSISLELFRLKLPHRCGAHICFKLSQLTKSYINLYGSFTMLLKRLLNDESCETCLVHAYGMLLTSIPHSGEGETRSTDEELAMETGPQVHKHRRITLAECSSTIVQNSIAHADDKQFVASSHTQLIDSNRASELTEYTT